MLKNYSLFLVILLVISSQAFAQKKSTTKENRFYKIFNDKPSIELSYGLSDIRLNGDKNSLAGVGLFELKLGYTMQRQSGYGKKILNYNNRYLFLSNASSDNSAKKNNEGIESNMWRFGVGNKKGYCLKLGSVAVMPYTSNSFAWSRFEYTNQQNSMTDYSSLDDFNEAFRFGSTSEAGINLQLAPGFSIEPKYEISDIYPRHLFGKQLMSSVIEISGIYLIDRFTRAVMMNAPVAGTFVNFILKNAYEYGFYQLRKDKMNWPFTSAAPLRYNTFKLGMTFTF